MPPRNPILEFESATLVADGWHSASLDDFSLTLHPGELALVHFDSRAGHGPLADAAMGLIEPAAGVVRFDGEDWQQQRPAAASHRRGRIGRYFGKRGWVYHLDLDENVTLRERHHSHRPVADIYAEAEWLAKAMVMTAGLPTERPGRIEPIDLQRAACVRMLLGRPPLIIVDEPTTCLLPRLHEPLIDEVQRARNEGAAVLWLTADPLIWESQALAATTKIDQSAKKTAAARLDTAIAFSSVDTINVPTAAGPQASR